MSVSLKSVLQTFWAHIIRTKGHFDIIRITPNDLAVWPMENVNFVS